MVRSVGTILKKQPFNFPVQPPLFQNCTKCGEYKSFEAFSFQTASKNGVRKWCRDCGAAYASKKARHYKLMDRYKITADEYDAMLERQGGVCAICKKECTSGNRLAVDHDHSTGRVRGLLCMHCNTLLGSAKDSSNTLSSAIEYLGSISG